MEFDKLSKDIIGLALEVHKYLGPGLLENTYKQCLGYELNKAGIKFNMEFEIPVKYKEIKISCGYRIDILVENAIVIELKSIEKITPIHEAQILTYMKLSNKKLGLLMNFNVRMLKEGIKRFVL